METIGAYWKGQLGGPPFLTFRESPSSGGPAMGAGALPGLAWTGVAVTRSLRWRTELPEDAMKLNFTDRARDMVLSFMDQEEDGPQALRIAVEGSPFAPNYQLTLVEAAARTKSDLEVSAGSFTVLVDEASVNRLDGARVDFVETIQESGFQITPDPDAVKAAIDEAGPAGELADRVRQVLDTEINPAVASHGGAINLVDVQGTEVFIEMSGGCQGCAMSRMTLRQGVERMVSQSVPEVSAIHDVTDHMSGENPYFT